MPEVFPHHPDARRAASGVLRQVQEPQVAGNEGGQKVTTCQLCLCGTTPGFPHAADCPRPLFNASVDGAEEARWVAERDVLRSARYDERNDERRDAEDAMGRGADALTTGDYNLGLAPDAGRRD